MRPQAPALIAAAGLAAALLLRRLGALRRGGQVLCFARLLACSRPICGTHVFLYGLLCSAETTDRGAVYPLACQGHMSARVPSLPRSARHLIRAPPLCTTGES